MALKSACVPKPPEGNDNHPEILQTKMKGEDR